MFKELHNIKAKAKENKAVNEEKVNDDLKEGISLFGQFMKTKDIKVLKKSSDQFFTVLNSKRNKAEPYFYISQIFYIFGDKQKAIDYLKAAEEVEPEYKELPKLRKLIFS
jgi:hypothetical protein